MNSKQKVDQKIDRQAKNIGRQTQGKRKTFYSIQEYSYIELFKLDKSYYMYAHMTTYRKLVV